MHLTQEINMSISPESVSEEDTFSGVTGQSRELVQFKNGKIAPIEVAAYDGEIAMHRNIALTALIESATEVTSQQLKILSDPAQIAAHVPRTQERVES